MASQASKTPSLPRPTCSFHRWETESQRPCLVNDKARIRVRSPDPFGALSIVRHCLLAEKTSSRVPLTTCHYFPLSDFYSCIEQTFNGLNILSSRITPPFFPYVLPMTSKFHVDSQTQNPHLSTDASPRTPSLGLIGHQSHCQRV